MSKFIWSLDFGSTNTKCLLMQVNKDTITIKDKNVFLKNKNLNNLLLEFLNKNCSLDDLEVIILTGAGSSYFNKNFFTTKIIKVDEFYASSIGGLILSKTDNGIVVNVGTGTSFVYGDINKYEYLGGTGLGAGTFCGLGKFITKNSNISELFEIANCGNYKNVDLIISDISKTNILNLNQDTTASNLAKIENSKESDILAGIINLITQNIGLQINLVKKNYILEKKISDVDIIITGGFIKNKIVREHFDMISKFTSVIYKYVDYEYCQYSTCIGAYEYYLIKMRENLMKVNE